MADTLTFTDQSGAISRYVNIGTDDPGKKAALSAAYEESVNTGRALKALTYTTDTYGVSAIKFGLASEIEITAVTANTVIQDVLPAGSKIVAMAVKNFTANAFSLKAGNNGDMLTEYFDATAINALPESFEVGDYVMTLIAVDKEVGETDMPLYLSSSNWNSASIDIIIYLIT